MNVHIEQTTPRVACACANTLGEGVLWDQRTQFVFWVDIKNPAIFALDTNNNQHFFLKLDERVGFVVLTENTDILIAGFQTGLKLINWRTGNISHIADPEPHLELNRINDGVVGPDGCIYFGSMDNGEIDPTGSFWRWDGQNFISWGQKNIAITNGPAFSPNGKTIYTVDTLGQKIYIHQFAENGLPDEGQLLITFEPAWGNPDGLAIDNEGCLWICHWGMPRISRFSPDGTLLSVLPVPTPQVTKCAFAGPTMSQLYISSAAIERDPHLDPMAGHLFIVETTHTGPQPWIAKL